MKHFCLFIHYQFFSRERQTESGMKKNNGKNKMREGEMRWLTSSFLNLSCLFCCRLGQSGAPGGLQQAGTSAWPAARERAPILGFTKSQSPQGGGGTGVGGQESGQPAEGHWRWIQCHSSAQSGKRRDKAHLHWSEIETKHYYDFWNVFMWWLKTDPKTVLSWAYLFFNSK